MVLALQRRVHGRRRRQPGRRRHRERELDLRGLALCCSFGYYRCPTTGAIFDYEALACSSGPEKSTAASRCDVACAATCVDSGWIDPCSPHGRRRGRPGTDLRRGRPQRRPAHAAGIWWRAGWLRRCHRGPPRSSSVAPRYLTSTCHVANVVESALLAAERGSPGEIYFLTDGPPVEARRLHSASGIASRNLPSPDSVATR